MSVNLKRDANTIIDLNAKTLEYKQLHEIIKKTTFVYSGVTATYTVVGIPFDVSIIDSVTKEKVVAEIEITNNSVKIMTSVKPTNPLNITVMSTLL